MADLCRWWLWLGLSVSMYEFSLFHDGSAKLTEVGPIIYSTVIKNSNVFLFNIHCSPIRNQMIWKILEDNIIYYLLLWAIEIHGSIFLGFLWGHGKPVACFSYWSLWENGIPQLLHWNKNKSLSAGRDHIWWNLTWPWKVNSKLLCLTCRAQTSCAQASYMNLTVAGKGYQFSSFFGNTQCRAEMVFTGNSSMTGWRTQLSMIYGVCM